MSTRTQVPAGEWVCPYCWRKYASPTIEVGRERKPDARYCWETIPVYGPRRESCSDACRKRMTAWNRWVTVTRVQAVTGDVRRPVRYSQLSMVGVDDAITRYRS